MCGRFSFSPRIKMIEDRFDVKVDPVNYKPRYNCAPSQMHAVVTNLSPGLVDFFKWGLIPYWAKDPAIGNKMINARCETILEKPSYATPFKKRRCLVLSDGFYEWKTLNSKTKIPYRICFPGNTLFAMAGIWDKWTSPDGNILYSFSIITTGPNQTMEGIHNRMPVILEKEMEKTWLQSDDLSELINLLKPYPDGGLISFPVSQLLNSPVNDFPGIMEPVKDQA